MSLRVKPTDAESAVAKPAAARPAHAEPAAAKSAGAERSMSASLGRASRRRSTRETFVAGSPPRLMVTLK